MRWFWALVRPARLRRAAEEKSRRAQLAMDGEDYAGAAALYRAAVCDLESSDVRRRQETWIDVLSRHSAALYLAGRPGDAATVALRVLAVVERAFPEDSSQLFIALENAVTTLTASGRLRAATVYQERVVHLTDNRSAAYLKLVELHDLCGQSEQTLAAAQRLLEVCSKHDVAVNFLGIAQLRLEHWQAALASFEEAFHASRQATSYREAKGSWVYARNVAAALVGLGDVDGATAWLDRAESLVDPSERSPETRAILEQVRGELCLRSGDLRSARASLTRAAAGTDQRALRAKLLLAELERREGNREASNRLAEEVLWALAPLECPAHPIAVRARTFK